MVIENLRKKALVLLELLTDELSMVRCDDHMLRIGDHVACKLVIGQRRRNLLFDLFEQSDLFLTVALCQSTRTSKGLDQLLDVQPKIALIGQRPGAGLLLSKPLEHHRFFDLEQGRQLRLQVRLHRQSDAAGDQIPDER